MMNIAESIVPRATSQMQARWTAFGRRSQPKIQRPEEGGLEEERREALHRQRSAEDVADEARVGRPVHAELELLHQAGDDADGDVDQQQGAEELGEPLVLGLAVAVPGGLQDRDEEGEPDGRPGRTGSGRCSSSRTASEQVRSSSGGPPVRAQARGRVCAREARDAKLTCGHLGLPPRSVVRPDACLGERPGPVHVRFTTRIEDNLRKMASMGPMPRALSAPPPVYKGFLTEPMSG